MNFKFVGPLALLAVLFFGDQIRINRPAHKYRLTVEVEFSEKGQGARGLRAKGVVASMSPHDFGFEVAVRVPVKAPVGDAVLTVTLPDNKEVGGTPLVIPGISIRE